MSIVRDAITAELQELISISRKLAADIGSAKTQTKQKYLSRKLKTNNHKVFELLVSLERLNQKDAKQDNE